MSGKSLNNYINYCKRNSVAATLKGLKNWSMYCR